MVRGQLMSRGVRDERVLAATSKVPREEFVPQYSRAASYTDQPLPIGYGQTISQPYVVAFMTEQLRLSKNDRVLEIGTGSGYQAAILAELAAEVYTIQVKAGDGYKGWPEHGPFDAITVTCAPDHVPPPLIEQLKEGGRMIIPVGGFGDQELYLFQKKNGELQRRAVLPVRFVPMTGEAEKK
ncbi:MAG: protein-L-isoaspartate(D-aspartate) O-methyltransferase [Verrucomicrobia bacterium]|nr:MAG: protein-L-isoaspartate(D-aspartate) O-methyltransferase [Verrucomicrobiota bacterium]